MYNNNKFYVVTEVEICCIDGFERTNRTVYNTMEQAYEAASRTANSCVRWAVEKNSEKKVEIESVEGRISISMLGTYTSKYDKKFIITVEEREL